MKFWLIVITLIALALVGANYIPEPVVPLTQNDILEINREIQATIADRTVELYGAAIVEQVYKGDTISIRWTHPAGMIGRRTTVRLAGVSSPGASSDIGTEATLFTQEWLLNREVGIELVDPDLSFAETVFAYVWIHRPMTFDRELSIRNDMFNSWILSFGFARINDSGDQRYLPVFRKDQDGALTNKRGLWR